MLNHCCQKYFLVFLGVLISFSAFAKKEPPVVSVLKGNMGQVKPDSSITVTDEIAILRSSDIESTYSILNLISVGIDEENAKLIPGDFSDTVILSIIRTDLTGAVDSLLDTFIVNYTSYSGGKYMALVSRKLQNYKEITVRVVSIGTNVSWDASEFLIIKNELTAYREYRFECSSPVDNIGTSLDNLNTQNDELNVFWSYNGYGADEFDLEWAWVDEGSLSDYQINGVLDSLLVFENNASRISILDSSSYRIPLFYDSSGRLFIRVRPIHIRHDGFRVEGRWSYWKNSGDSLAFYYFSGHENSLNWQASTSFAEGGKRKTVIQYYDGSLRQRQMVTKDYQTHTTLVAETFYDHQGRPAIQVLPAPTLNEIISYSRNFNRSINDMEYGKAAFDIIGDHESVCDKASLEMDSVSGASQYYSIANPYKDTGIHRFIPDAAGYPFTETRYAADGSGRISSQSGVGPVHRIGSGHETKYFYEAASSEDLIPLFGTDVGDASHYFKNTVKDANGQYSVSYVDMQGRTVATAMAGPVASGLDSLPSYRKVTKTKSIMQPESNIVIGNSIVASNSFTIKTPDIYTFQYNLDPGKLSLLHCKNDTLICYDCLYDLKIVIISDCGNGSDAPVFDSSYRNFSLGQLRNSCDGSSSNQFQIMFSRFLSEGSYTITKSLSLSDSARQYYQNMIFLPNDTCKSQASFLQVAYNAVTENENCRFTCNACLEKLGTYNDFRVRFVNSAGAGIDTVSNHAAFEASVRQAYEDELGACEQLCKGNLGNSMNWLAMTREFMLMDMVPGIGQYASLDSLKATIKYNVFSTITYPAGAGLNPAWKHPLKINSDGSASPDNYHDESGDIDELDSLIQNDGITKEEFASNFKSSWSESLLAHHPEYSKLYYAEKYLKPSFEFEEELNSVESWDTALAKGYLNDLPNRDSFFYLANSQSSLFTSIAGFKAQMLNKIGLNYQTSTNSSYGITLIFSMWQIAQAMVLCKDLPNAPDQIDTNRTSPAQTFLICLNAQPKIPAAIAHNDCKQDWDMIWRAFKTLYLTERKKYIMQWLNSQPIFNPAVNVDIQSFHDEVAPNPPLYTLRFNPDLSSLGNQMGGTLSQINADLQSGNYSGASASTQNAINQSYDSTCLSYAFGWVENLRKCPAIDSLINLDTLTWKLDSAHIINLLVSICKGGSDIDHMLGASSLPPNLHAIHDTVWVADFTDFSEVIRMYLRIRNININALCHPYLIDFPKPYDKTPAIGYEPVVTKPADCECEKIKSLKYLYDQVPGANSSAGPSFSQYIKLNYGTTISQSDLNKLLAMCGGSVMCKILDSAIALPPLFQCFGSDATIQKPCISCLEYSNLENEFRHEFGLSGDIPIYTDTLTDSIAAINRALADFINYHTGFQFHWFNYLEFKKQCEQYSQIACDSIAKVVNLFKSRNMFGSWASIDSCHERFAVFFNSYFGTFYSYAYIDTVFLAKCKLNDDFCIPVINCDTLNSIVNGFYDNYGVNIIHNPNCRSIFSAYVSYRLWKDYSYEAWKGLYGFLCPGSCFSEIDALANCILLKRVYDAYVQTMGASRWNNPNCQLQFESFFNQYLGLTSSPLVWSEIVALYQVCFDNGCGPDPNNLCNPPYQCEYAHEVVDAFRNNISSEVLDSDSCTTAFVSYWNDYYNTNLSFYEIRNFLKQCDIKWDICNPAIECVGMNILLQKFRDSVVIGSYEDCEQAFVDFFNDFYGTGYKYADIEYLYVKYCGVNLHLCQGSIFLNSCTQLQWIVNEFNELYPSGGAGLGNNCKNLFVAFFNNQVNDNLDFSTIQKYYKTLCGDTLSLCYGSCTAFYDFVLNFNAIYGAKKMPDQARKAVFAYLFNERFYAGNQGFTYSKISELLASCYDSSFIQFNPHDSIQDKNVLLNFKEIYFIMHPGNVPEDCEAKFSAWFNFCFGTQLTYNEIREMYENIVGRGSGYICGLPDLQMEYISHTNDYNKYMAPMLCGLSEPLEITVPITESSGCEDLNNYALNVAEEHYNYYIDSVKNVFDTAYINKCLQVGRLESLTMTGSDAEYHYTLYYYDQAGNLVRTVPPEGVDLSKFGWVSAYADSVRKAKYAGTILRPDHYLTTDYRYNTLNQVVAQQTPDAGLSRFWYDSLGRLVVSQNAQQLLDGHYSYTLYDKLGRITEVGQKSIGDNPEMSQAISQDTLALRNWIVNAGGPREQVTQTVYDVSYANGGDFLAGTLLTQQHLRNRVSYTMLFDTEPLQPTYQKAATYYSYDIHGNVDTLVQDLNFGRMKLTKNGQSSGNRYKKLVYDYDLISGKVNQVSYQPGMPDCFYHRYEYDDENRITAVYTSQDSVIWERDARYSYYKHGPVARVVLGQQQVQGLDYAYTLQGWMKGLNSTALSPAFDMGGDGKEGPVLNPVARDAFGFSLHYYDSTDYLPIKAGQKPFAAVAGLGSDFRPLYNGNIASMAVNLPRVGEPMLYNYHYDQLNRLAGMDAWKGLQAGGNNWQPVKTDDYKERIKYDANGNITSYLRHGAAAVHGLSMDSMRYQYERDAAGRLVNNRLMFVRDFAGGSYTDDIKDQDVDNYAYDAIGNLIRDSASGILKVDWNVYGKISRIIKKRGNDLGSNEKDTIIYHYDAGGNRIAKQIGGDHTYYVRDASGNIMSIYSVHDSVNDGRLTQSEIDLYGSSRLGVYNPRRDVETGGAEASDRFSVVRGWKNYELTNHLGNVLATVSDRKLQVRSATDTTMIGYYEADVLTANDYYPGGMQQPGRDYQTGSNCYRYSINGQELESELNRNITTALFWEYDSRIVRRWNVDPMAKERISWAPYNAMRCNPILNIDPIGALDGEYYKTNNNGELEHVGSDGIDDKKVYVQNSFGNKEFNGSNYYEVLGGQEAFKGDYNEGHKYVDNMALSRVKNLILEANGRRADKDVEFERSPTSVGTNSDIKWVLNESIRGDIDFKFFIAGKNPKTGGKPATQTLYLAGDYYMNVNTFGNCVWGAYGAQLELPKAFFAGLAQVGSVKQGRLDESHEQKAIGLGYDFMKMTIKFEGSNNYKYSYNRKP